MKIDLLTLEYPPQIGGIATYLVNLYKNLPHTVRVFAPTTTTIETWWWRPRWYFFYRRLRRNYHNAATRPDEIHVAQILPLGWIARLLFRRWHIPYTIFFHGTDLLTAASQSRKWLQTQKIVADATRIIVNSQATAALYKKLLPQGREPVVITPGVNSNERTQITAYEQLAIKFPLRGRRILFFLGRLVERKGLLIALAALKELERFSDLILVVAGSGPTMCLAADFVKTNGLDDQVLFLGNISEEEKMNWYAAAYLFWFPAQPTIEWEGYGITSLESQAAGCPAIVSNVGGLPETVRANESGIIIEPTASALAAATANLLQDAALWQRLRSGARQNAAAHSWERERELFITTLTPSAYV